MAQEIGDNNLIETWASGGNVVAPSAGKVAGGWEFEEQPPHEYMNWIHNTLGQQINYLLRSGVPAWNAATPYLTGDAVISGGIFWIALAPSTNSTPGPANTDWQGIDANTFATAAQGALADTALQSADIGDFETTTELNARDTANRARANHTGAQAIATVTGLQAALDGKAPTSHTHTLADITDAGTAAAANVDEIGVPAGAVQMFARQTAPTGWLKCDGLEVSRATYATLFAAIGTTFGPGNGSTTFNLPDLRGEFVRGWDDGRGIDPARAFGSFQSDAIRNIEGSAGFFNSLAGTIFSGAMFEKSSVATLDSNDGGDTAYETGFDASLVVPTADENRPRNVALLYCIKV
ncbi:MAG: tail fiber protein [Octadecabacter sp.]|nr:tail fiber protein [Octadecabacter sp.]